MICSKWFLSLCSLSFAASTIAGDSAVAKLMGFSKDGKYVAFETFGVKDGSGFAYATIAILNVDKNEYAIKPFRVQDSEKTLEKLLGSHSAMRKSVLAQAGASLKKFGIVTGPTERVRQVGINYLGKEFSEEGRTLQFENRNPFFQIGLSAGSCQLKLDQIGTGKFEQLWNYEIMKLKLSLNCESNYEYNKFANGTEKISKVLQEDANVPASRFDPFNYEIETAFVFDPDMTEGDSFDFKKSKIVVLVRYLGPGFEGPNLDYLAVSGNFD